MPLRAFTTDVGVDVVSFGGTKNGLMLGEAIVVLNQAAVRGVDFLRKSSMQLASKMRFVSAQFDALLAGDLWLRNARHANAMAAAARGRGARHRPASRSSGRCRPTRSSRSSAAGGHRAAAEAVPRSTSGTRQTGEVRWMCAFDTTEEDVDAFAAAVAAEMGAA